MKLTVYNETDEDLSLAFLKPGSTTYEASLSIAPHTSATSAVRSTSTTVRVNAQVSEKSDAESVSIPSGPFTTFPLKLGAKWKSVRIPADSPWRMYRSKISKGHYRLSVFPRRNLASFLSEMPDSLPLSSLLLPGTHDTMAFYGWPISQCQSLSTPLDVQLHSGIRVLDVRLSVVDGRLLAYHGIYPQRSSFQDILRAVHDFLASPLSSRETIVMSIKQEDFARTPLPYFSQCVHDEIMGGPGGRDMWFLENRIPRMGEVRGKVVMLSRFGGDGTGWENGLEGLGIHPTAWPDSERNGFTWTLKGTLVRTHDWYSIPSFLSIPEKAQLSTEILVLPPGEQPFPILNISFFSASSVPLAFPPTIAKGFGWPNWGFGVEGVNGRVGRWLVDKLSGDQVHNRRTEKGEPLNLAGLGGGDVRIRGWTLMDFYREPEDGVVPLLIECNFRGRNKGEEGWE
ncbi:PLC-like phosphodiesterase [Dichomitus squalens]|uniref:PLC-like phosphodiesterase n=1 Tax=Dichomitus squalens TaxID=114155 RepID=A0A4Q9MJ47_9APHY|nr:PLC-like phosphodiesterase [Dichomitus squalens]